MTSEELRKILRSNLAKNLNGKENINKRHKIMEVLNKTDNAIKSWCAPGSNSIPAANEIPIICEIIGLSINQLFELEDDRLKKAYKLLNAYENHEDSQNAVKKLLDIEDL